jgi:hypothetical protein
LAIALLSALLLTVLVAQVGNWLSDPPTAADTAAPAGPDWTGVVIELDLARSRALAEGDPALLEQVYLPGSAAAAADAAIIDALADNGWRVLDGRHDIVNVQVLDGAGSDTGSDTDTGSGSGSDSGSVSGSVSGRIRVAVVDTLAARPVVDGTGQQVSITTARGAERRVLVLDATDAGYRISSIEPG